MTDTSQKTEPKVRAKRRLWVRLCKVVLLTSFVTQILAVFLAYVAWHRLHLPARVLKSQWVEPETRATPSRPLAIGHRGSGLPLIDSPDLNPAGKTAQQENFGATTESEPVLNTDGIEKLIGNTENAIRRAINAGVDWIEIDVRETARSPDGQPGELILFHDKKLNEKTNAAPPLLDTPIEDCTWEELQDLRWNVRGNEKILRLENVFSLFQSSQPKWIVDIKQNGIHQRVINCVDQSVASGEIRRQDVIIFGNAEILSEVQETKYQRGHTALWSNLSNQVNAAFFPSSIIKQTKQLNCKYLVLPIGFANAKLIKLALDEDLSVWVYGTEEKLEMEYLLRCGVSGFIIDDSDPFMAWINSAFPLNLHEATN